MDDGESSESELVYTLEQYECGVRSAECGVGDEPDAEVMGPSPLGGDAPTEAKLVAPDWRGRVSALSDDALRAFWGEAVVYARWEIGHYARWRELNEPVLADGYDAEGVVQAAFERLMQREAGSVPIFYSADDIRHELRSLTKHRVRWLHERSETGLVVGEWDVLPPKPDGELISIFDYLPGRIASPDEELIRKEKEGLLGEFKAGFEATLGKRQDLREVFNRVWDGQKRREVACELGIGAERVKALQAQLRRRLERFGAEAQGRQWIDGVME